LSNLSFAATGFVSSHAGSVASANAVLLRGLLERNHEISFFTKPSFVDPRPVFNGQCVSGQFHLVDCTNAFQDGLRRKMSPSGNGLWGRAWGTYDAASYNRGLVRAMARYSSADLDLWLGDWARGRGTRPVISFVQGPPGTDARSVFTRRKQIIQLSGKAKWLQLAAAAKWRLGPGLPPFQHSDHVIVGSDWSRRFLIDQYQLPEQRAHALPYPIDLSTFDLPKSSRPKTGPLRLFWLGRFVPRKRLDLFLDGLAMAIKNGVDAEGWVVGQSGFAAGYERLLDEFPYPKRLKHWNRVERKEVPAMLGEVDVMAQPSDEENFGSSVAEALACGVPAIVGATNGTGDYICERSVQLSDDKPETFAAAIDHFVKLKREGELADRYASRLAAENYFDPERVVDRLESLLKLAIGVSESDCKSAVSNASC